jgi:hypothetical protein
MTAFLTSCQQHGIELVENSLTADAAIIWSVTWAGRLSENQKIYNHYRKLNKPVIILEVGSLHRGRTWKIAVNHITADGYYGHQSNLDHDRPAKLNLLQPVLRSTKNSVLIVAQNNQSQQTSNLLSIDHWIASIVEHLKLYTDRQLIVRPHPRCKLDTSALPADVTVEPPKKLLNTYDSFDIDYSHHAVVNYNSGAGIQAALNGTNIIVDASSLAHQVSIDIDSIEHPVTIDRAQWLIEISHTEYLTTEIQQGLWIQRLAQMLPI